MKALGDVLKLSSAFLSEKNIPNARRLVEDLLAHLLCCKRIDLYMRFDQPLEEKELVVLRSWVKRLAMREPIEYILGEVDFFGCRIKTDKRALIPRVETELLVEMVAKNIKDQKVLWDICSGSGCIGISLKKKFPHLNVVLVDISPEALDLARENAALNDVCVEFICGDLLTPLQGRKADIIVSNPPYVSSEEFRALDDSVCLFEPKLALLGGETGLEYYQKFSIDIQNFLNERGQVYFEIGYCQGNAIKQMFSNQFWRRFELFQDLSSKDRFFFLEKQ